MLIENQVRAIAGMFILISIALFYFHSDLWFYFTIFVGANLLQSAFTKFCPLEIVLCKMQKTDENKSN